jgi:hypothetical protein
MRQLTLILGIIACVTSCYFLAAEPITCPVVLLNGYQHKAKLGTDSSPGIIYKAGGLRIQYDIGGMALSYITPEQVGKHYINYTVQVINGKTVRLAFKKESPAVCVITFPDYHANFTAEIKTPQEMAEFLLIALSFNPEFLKSR